MLLAPVYAGFQSTLPTRGSDFIPPKFLISWPYFNPRSPRGGATSWSLVTLVKPLSISIHAPHEGERRVAAAKTGRCWRFQSTLPTRGSDAPATGGIAPSYHFNPRSPRGGATSKLAAFFETVRFQSTLPTRGSDLRLSMRIAASTYFNPRSPRGGATRSERRANFLRKFQSTLPTRGSDTFAHLNGTIMPISIHAPHEGERPLTAGSAAIAK